MFTVTAAIFHAPAISFQVETTVIEPRAEWKVVGINSAPSSTVDSPSSKPVIPGMEASEKAYERQIIGKKSDELVQYYEQCRQARDLPSIPGAVIISCDEKLSFEPMAAGSSPGRLKVPEREGILRRYVKHTGLPDGNPEPRACFCSARVK
mgnify:CR=1 FL=1